MSVFIALLFFALTPGVLLSLPKKGSLMMKAAVHAVVFAAVFYFIQKPVMNFLYREGFQGRGNPPVMNAMFGSNTAVAAGKGALLGKPPAKK